MLVENVQSPTCPIDPALEREARSAPSIVEVLRTRALRQPDHVALTFVDDNGGAPTDVSLGELDRDARRIAALLQTVEIRGRRVIVALPPGKLYNSAFWGCLYAGAVAVPVYPPFSPIMAARLSTIAADCGAAIALTDSLMNQTRKRLEHQAPELSRIRWIEVDRLAPGTEGLWVDPCVAPRDLAFLQYTSGSTGDPKGVMISHHNLQSNLVALIEAGENVHGIDFTRGERQGADRGLSWLPPYHDMGLNAMLLPVVARAHSVQCSPMWFLRRPERWVRFVSQYRIATTAAPNFAYEMAIERAALLEHEQLDLSCWKLAVCGAEPVHQTTIERFCEVFGRWNFEPASFRPTYGMAEATLLVSSAKSRKPSLCCYLDRDALQADRVVLVDRDAPNAVPVVGCGAAQGDLVIVIADPASHRLCASDRVGEIWLRGSNIAQGYWGRAELSAEVFDAYLSGPAPDVPTGPYMRTGDKGFWHEGELFIKGRLKETIIIRGNNYYPHDIETTAEQACDALMRRGGAAFSLEHGAGERLVLVHEVRSKNSDVQAVGDSISSAILAAHGVHLSELVLIARHSLPRTSSGKPRRNRTRDDYLSGSLRSVGVWKGTAP